MHMQDINESMAFLSMKTTAVPCNDLYLYLVQFPSQKYPSYEVLGQWVYYTKTQSSVAKQ